MGRIVVDTRITNLFDEDKSIRCGMLVDTGAGVLILPSAWKDRLGAFKRSETVSLQLSKSRCAQGRSVLAGGNRDRRVPPGLERGHLRGYGRRRRRWVRTVTGLCDPGTSSGGRGPGGSSSGAGPIHRYEVGTCAFILNYGRGQRAVDLPDGLDVTVIAKQAMPLLADPVSAMEGALTRLRGVPAAGRGGRTSPSAYASSFATSRGRCPTA